MQTSVKPTLILNTKLQKPILRAQLIHRERLSKILDSSIQQGKRLTLISAPAGYGKTTLTADWLNEANHYAWLSIDPEDNDVIQFFTYLAVSFQKLGLNSFSPIGLTESQLNQAYFETVSTHLINEAAGLSGNFVIVLDDFHLITNSIIISALSFLIQHLPAQMHFIILSRTRPSFPLARLRACNQLTEITGMDLKFNLKEAATLFSRIIGLSLSNSDLESILKRTEGWITGLQLAAISLKRLESDSEISEFIENFSGSSRLIADYFLEEVFYQQPIVFQQFLLKTALLERMNAPVCVTMTGQADAQSILECLERTNLFVEPLDSKRGWFRYHTLFSELLNQRCRLEMNHETLCRLHNTASKWFSENGLIYEAVQHAVKAQNFIEAAKCLSSLSQTPLHTIENLPKLVSWIKLIPGEILDKHPDLHILLIKIPIIQGQIKQAEAALIALKSKNLPAYAAPSPLNSELTALETIITGELEGFTVGKQIAMESLRNTPETDLCSLAQLNLVLGITLIHTGQLIEAERVLTNAALQSKRTGNRVILHKSTAHQVEIKLLKGELRQALQSGISLLQLEDVQSILDPAILSQVTLNLSQASYELNDLKSAWIYAEQSFRYGKKSGLAHSQILAGFQLIFTAAALGQQETCEKYLSLLHDTIFMYPTPQLQALYASLKTKYLLLIQDTASASSWVNANQLKLLSSPDQDSLPGHKLLASYYLSRHPAEPNPEILTSLLRILNNHLKRTKSNQNLYESIKLQNLSALICQALNQKRSAVEYLKANIELADLKGFTRSFVDLGFPMFSLIPKTGYSSAQQRLISSFNNKTNQATSNHLTSQLVEPLSKREMEVLKLIAAGLSNKEISSKLYLAQGTVKKHNNNLFSKLAVHRRTEAIARARQLGIL